MMACERCLRGVRGSLLGLTAVVAVFLSGCRDIAKENISVSIIMPPEFKAPVSVRVNLNEINETNMTRSVLKTSVAECAPPQCIVRLSHRLKKSQYSNRFSVNLALNSAIAKNDSWSSNEAFVLTYGFGQTATLVLQKTNGPAEQAAKYVAHNSSGSGSRFGYYVFGGGQNTIIDCAGGLGWWATGSPELISRLQESYLARRRGVGVRMNIRYIGQVRPGLEDTPTGARIQGIVGLSSFEFVDVDPCIK